MQSKNNNKGKIILESERLQFVEVSSLHMSELLKIHQNKEVMKFICDGKYDWTFEEFQMDIADHIKYYPKGYGFWATIEKKTGIVCGKAGIIENVEKDGTIEHELGYLFGQNFWNNGLATEASHSIKKYAFNTLKLSELVAYTFKENIPSIKVLEKIGMKKIDEFKVKEFDIVKFSISNSNLN